MSSITIWNCFVEQAGSILCQKNPSSGSMFLKRIANAPRSFFCSAGVRLIACESPSAQAHPMAQQNAGRRIALQNSQIVFRRNERADMILFGTSAEAAVSSAIAADMHRPPIDLTEKHPSTIYQRFFRNAISSLGMTLAQCTSPRLLVFPSWLSLGRPIPSAPPPSRRVAASFRKNHIAALVFCAAAPRITGA